MKRIHLFCMVLTLATAGLSAQKNLRLGAGYFGHTLVHPGIVVEAELEHMFTEGASLPLYAGLGAYIHPRNHYGAFLEVGTGFRQYFRTGLFIEERVAVGMLQTFLHSDGVYEVDESGQVSEASRVNPVDFMPSVSLGLGFQPGKSRGGQDQLWLRPKLYFQLPYKTMANYHLAIQVGYTHTLKSR